MSQPVPPSPPRFLPQALAIVIPLAILTAIALRTLREDARQAVARARTQAEELAPIVANFGATALLTAAEDALRARQAWEAQSLHSLGLTPDPVERQTFLRDLPTAPEQWAPILDSWLQAQPEAFAASHEALAPVLVWNPAVPTSFPSPVPETSGIAPWLTRLAPLERREWHALQRRSLALGPGESSAPLRSAWDRLATNAPTAELRAVATFESLRLGSPAAQDWLAFLRQHGAVPSESGLPLAVAATMELLHRSRTETPAHPSTELLDALVHTLQQFPSPLNGALIQAARQAFSDPPDPHAPLFEILADLDAVHSRCRRALEHLSISSLATATNAFQWTASTNAPESRLACSIAGRSSPSGDPVTPPASDESRLRFVVLLSRAQVEAALRNALHWARLPHWAGVRIEIAGQVIDLHLPGDSLARAPVTLRPPGPGGTDGTDVPEAGLEPHFEAIITLADPDLLLADVVRRQRNYGLLVLAVAAVASLGLWQARRSFLRQRQLAVMKSGFVSSVSHELRAPIASIRLLAEGLERDTITAPEQRRDYLRFIIQECRRLSGLIENVLDHARIEQGRKQYDLEPVDPVRLVQDTVRLMEPCAAAAGVSLAFDPPPAGVPLPDASWDPGAIQQALVNLIDNAIKHSPPGSPIDIRLSVAGPAFHIAVVDRGPGIPAAEQEKVFDPFYRRGSELRRETRGIGIGLSLARHTVEAHGGRIRIDSTPGAGSTFTLELPATTTPRPAVPIR